MTRSQLQGSVSRLPLPGGPRARLLGLAAMFVVCALIFVDGLFGGMTRTSGGEVAVVRNGGPFDNHRIRQIIDPASGLTWTGWWSQVHAYPAQQRFYTITSRAGGGERPGVDVVQTPSSDGVNVGIEGTLYFALTGDHDALRAFDTKFGTRKFRGADGVSRSPFGSEDGWAAFLDQILRPVIDNDLRQQINNFRCAELVSSCALVQNTNAGALAPAPAKGSSNNVNIAKAQDAINASLADDLRRTLGGDFFTGIRFNLVRITLPPGVQSAVDEAQAAFAQVSQAQARVASARADAEANRIRQRGYRDCPACARIDELKAIPSSVTTFAPGSGFAVTPGR